MARKIISLSQMCRIGGDDNSWTNLWGLSTAGNPRAEIVARRNGKWLGAKCLTLYVDPGSGCLQEERTFLPSFAVNLARSTKRIFVYFLAVDRPLTYFPFPEGVNLKENWQYEIPGGVVEPNEDQRHAALREMLEENGMKEGGRVLQTATLVGLPFATDSGGQAEMYSYEVALVEGKPKPTEKEGIHPDQCELVYLENAIDFLLNAQTKGILIEAHALTSLLLLEREMFKT